MGLHEELKGIDEEKLKASFETVVSEGGSGDGLMIPSDDYPALLNVGLRAYTFFDNRADEVRREAEAASGQGIPVDREKLARAIGRIEGMGAGFSYAVDTFISYADAEKLEKETGLSNNQE